MTATLRAGRDVDLLPVGALHFRSRAAAYAHILPAETLAEPPAAALAEWWTERWKWERDTHRLAVAADGDRIVGFTYVGPDDEPGVMLLNAIHVDPQYVGSGVGRQLMADALPHLGHRAVLWVLAGNDRARRFYERGGWRFDGTTRVEDWNGVPTRQMRYALVR